MEAGKRRPASDTARAASKDEGAPPSPDGNQYP